MHSSARASGWPAGGLTDTALVLVVNSSQGCDPIDVVLVKRDGRLSGEAFVVLSNGMHVEMALSKNRSYMGRRYIEIYRAKKMVGTGQRWQDVQQGSAGRCSRSTVNGGRAAVQPPCFAAPAKGCHALCPQAAQLQHKG